MTKKLCQDKVVESCQGEQPKEEERGEEDEEEVRKMEIEVMSVILVKEQRDVDEKKTREDSQRERKTREDSQREKKTREDSQREKKRHEKIP